MFYCLVCVKCGREYEYKIVCNFSRSYSNIIYIKWLHFPSVKNLHFVCKLFAYDNMNCNISSSWMMKLLLGVRLSKHFDIISIWIFCCCCFCMYQSISIVGFLFSACIKINHRSMRHVDETVPCKDFWLHFLPNLSEMHETYSCSWNEKWLTKHFTILIMANWKCAQKRLKPFEIGSSTKRKLNHFGQKNQASTHYPII